MLDTYRGRPLQTAPSTVTESSAFAVPQASHFQIHSLPNPPPPTADPPLLRKWGEGTTATSAICPRYPASPARLCVLAPADTTA